MSTHPNSVYRACLVYSRAQRVDAPRSRRVRFWGRLQFWVPEVATAGTPAILGAPATPGMPADPTLGAPVTAGTPAAPGTPAGRGGWFQQPGTSRHKGWLPILFIFRVLKYIRSTSSPPGRTRNPPRGRAFPESTRGRDGPAPCPGAPPNPPPATPGRGICARS